jgi:hypothetical protein
MRPDPNASLPCPQCGSHHTPHPDLGPFCSSLCLNLAAANGKPKPAPKPKRAHA